MLLDLSLILLGLHYQMRQPVSLRLRSSRPGTIEGLLSFFSDRSSSSRHQSTLTLYHYRLVCLLTLSHVLVLQMSMLQAGGVTS